MLKNPVEGLKWGRLKVIEVNPYDMVVPGGTQGQMMVKLECTCGEVFEEDTEDVDKRIMKSCKKCADKGPLGSEESDGSFRTGLPGRPRSGRQRKVNVSITMLPSVLQWLDEQAWENRESMSSFAGRMLEEKMNSQTVKGEGD